MCYTLGYVGGDSVQHVNWRANSHNYQEKPLFAVISDLAENCFKKKCPGLNYEG